MMRAVIHASRKVGSARRRGKRKTKSDEVVARVADHRLIKIADHDHKHLRLLPLRARDFQGGNRREIHTGGPMRSFLALLVLSHFIEPDRISPDISNAAWGEWPILRLRRASR